MRFIWDNNYQKSLDKATQIAEKDTSRPSFHARPIANRMGDPNGIIYFNGRYHLFYQHNPLSCTKGASCWGHMSSKNLLDWRHHDIALSPTKMSEERCFSGSSIKHNGGVFIAYTSVMDWDSDDFTQGYAISKSKDLTEWEQVPSGLLGKPPKIPGYKIADDWRDPFLFKHKKDTYFIIGSNMKKNGQTYTAPLLYRATDKTLKNWEYRGMISIFSDKDFPNASEVWLECPNMVNIGNKWVLIGSPESAVKYFVGNFDVDKCKFNIETSGFISRASKNYYYASYVFYDENKKRHLMFGVCFGKDEKNGWRGVQVLPREIDIKSEKFIQKPIQEITKLRIGKNIAIKDKITKLKRPCFEIAGEILPKEKMKIVLSGKKNLTIDINEKRLKLGSEILPLDLKKKTKFRLFFDRSICEVFFGDTETVSYMERKLDIKSIKVEKFSDNPMKLWYLRDAKFC